MDALGRFKHFKRRMRRQFGCGVVSREADRHLTLAASIEQILEVARHEVLMGRQLDADSLTTLRDQLPIALMRAAIVARPQTETK